MGAVLTVVEDPVALVDSWSTDTNREHGRIRLDRETTPPLKEKPDDEQNGTE